MRVIFSRGIIIWAISIVLGGLLLFGENMEERRYSEAKELAELDEGTLSEGDYVIGEIRDLLVLHISNDLGSLDTSVCAELALMPFSYQMYNIPIKNGKYLRVMIADPQINRELARRTEAVARGEGFGEGIHIEGKLVADELGLNREWYALGEAVINVDHVIAPLVLKEADIRPNKAKLYGGVVILAMGLIVLLLGKLKGAITVEEERTPTYSRRRDMPYQRPSYRDCEDPMYSQKSKEQ